MRVPRHREDKQVALEGKNNTHLAALAVALLTLIDIVLLQLDMSTTLCKLADCWESLTPSWLQTRH